MTADAMTHAEWLAAVQEFADLHLRRRLAQAVENAIHTAASGQTERWIVRDGGPAMDHLSVLWSWKSEGDTSAQRTIHPDGRVDYLIAVDTDDPDAGPWLCDTKTGLGVRFMPGMGFDTPQAFLDWFETPGVDE